MNNPALAPDNWLTEILNKPSMRFSPGPEVIERGLSHPACEAVRSASQKACFIYSKILVSEVGGCALLEQLGFNLVDTNLVFDKQTGRPAKTPTPGRVRTAQFADEEAIAALAGSCFRYSRFHLDPRISPSAASLIKEQWVRGFFRGTRGQHMLVAEDGGKVSGFLQLLTPSTGLTVIDLIGVAQESRGRGLAKALIAYAEEQVTKGGALRVGTQVANIPSVRLYEGLGFRLVESSYVFHLHGRE